MKIKLSHGDGGKETDLLIKEVFHKEFNNDILLNSLDASIFNTTAGKIAFTTDSFVVKPIFFSGGDIGKLSICGTINDLVVSGSKPLFLSTSFIIEEGFSIDSLKKIVKSMAEVSRETGVKIITGDTKVVEKGSVDGIFINTSGIGKLYNDFVAKPIKEGDKIIITGGIAEHGTTIAIERYNLNIKGNIKSDCMPLSNITDKIQDIIKYIKLMKDPTRGGLGTAVNEIAEYSKLGIELDEEAIPLKKEVSSVNNLLGLDPLYLASEGRMIIVVDSDKSEEVLNVLKKLNGSEDSSVIGKFIKSKPIVYMKTVIGGKRIINTLEGSMLPRIC